MYGFAKQSGGDVAVESVVGHSTTFTLYLPRVDGVVAEAATPDGRAGGPILRRVSRGSETPRSSGRRYRNRSVKTPSRDDI